MIKKVGIITHYYKSQNYGGNLQAYALCRVIRKLGVETAEQISYDTYGGDKSNGNVYLPNLRSILNFPVRVVRHFIFKLRYFITVRQDIPYKNLFMQRTKAISSFNINQIPHSAVCYNRTTIDGADGKYDIYITGSDQVWNPLAMQPAYLLDFVKSGAPKISYAASLSCDKLSVNQLNQFKLSLSSFTGVSIREKNSVVLIRDVSPVPVEVVLDPTLLLTKDDWNEICSPPVVEWEYIFCYFLGDRTDCRKVATEFSQKNGLKIITLPHLLGHFRRCDKSFGDEHLYDVSPGQFLSLIRNASYIFTDSFHAVVFSAIYHKEYYVFKRGGPCSMESRIYSLVSLLGSDDHFCDKKDKVCLGYIDRLPPLNYARFEEKMTESRQSSLKYLKKNIEGTGEMKKKYV